MPLPQSEKHFSQITRPGRWLYALAVAGLLTAALPGLAESAPESVLTGQFASTEGPTGGQTGASGEGDLPVDSASPGDAVPVPEADREGFAGAADAAGGGDPASGGHSSADASEAEAEEVEALGPSSVSEDSESGSAMPTAEEDASDAESIADSAAERETTVLPQRSPLPVREGEGPVSAYVVPIEGPISPPVEYIVRRAAKDAIATDVELIILEIDTPGGRVDTTLEIMQMLDRFEGHTIAFVNDEAISAGAFITMATEIIYFAPGATIGAAEVVAGTGQDVPEAMKRKIESYIDAKVRAIVDDTDPFRAEVMRAMSQADYELVIDGQTIKEEGKLLTLTASEALREYGTPPRPLLGTGIVSSVEQLLTDVYGAGNYEIRSFEITWSEKLARWLEMAAPVFFALGLLGLYLEFQSPGFGLPGIAGALFMVLAFSSSFVIGLAGYEPMLLFGLGLVLLAVELFVLPGTLFFGIAGMLAVLVSLFWSLADVWPTEGPGPIDFEVVSIWEPLTQLMLVLVIVAVGAVTAFYTLPHTPLFRRIVLLDQASVPERAVVGGGGSAAVTRELPAVGAEGFATSNLVPSGEVDVGGNRFQATAKLGSIRRGEGVRVTGYRHFTLEVEKRDR